MTVKYSPGFNILFITQLVHVFSQQCYNTDKESSEKLAALLEGGSSPVSECVTYVGKKKCFLGMVPPCGLNRQDGSSS